MPPDMSAHRYQNNLGLNDPALRRQKALEHLRRDRAALRRIFPAFDTYSVNLQSAENKPSI